MKIRPILLSKSTVFSRSKICIFSRSDPRFGVTIWSDKVSSISLKFDYSRGKRLSLSIQKEFLKLIDTEQSYSAPLAHNFERQFSFGIFITHTDNWPRIPRIGLLRYTAHRLKSILKELQGPLHTVYFVMCFHPSNSAYASNQTW